MDTYGFEQLSEERQTGLIELYKAFGDGTRLRILSYLLKFDEVCVSDMADALGMTVSAVSHQLKILKQTRLIHSRRLGRNIYYAIADEHVASILRIAVEHILET